jgi:ATP-grasp domain, R2K clade family 3
MLLITQPRVGTRHNEILAVQMGARELGYEVLSAEFSWRLDEELIKSGVKGAPYGSQTFCEVIAQQMGWALKGNSFDWLAKIPYHFMGRQVDFMTLGEAKKITGLKFIKPADDKCFDAKVYEPGTFHPNEIIEDSTPTLVSDPVHFDMEFRTFVDGKKVYTWSNYIYYDQIAEPKCWEALPPNAGTPVDFVNTLLNELESRKIETMPSVVDVGWTEGVGWTVIETNQAWASGLYGCDPLEVVRVLELSCERIS